MTTIKHFEIIIGLFYHFRISIVVQPHNTRCISISLGVVFIDKRILFFLYSFKSKHINIPHFCYASETKGRFRMAFWEVSLSVFILT